MSQVIPVEETDFGSLMTMGLGTMTHRWLESFFEDNPDILGDEWILKKSELKLDRGLPPGWTGTLDWLFQHVPTSTYVIGDLKTAKPEALAYLNGKPKYEHVTQVSCYHKAMGVLLPQARFDSDIFVCYLPKGKTAKQETVLPKVVTAPAMPYIFDHLEIVTQRVYEYVTEFKRTGDPLNKYLAPMPAPELKISWDKERAIWNVTARPHWTEEYIGVAWGEEYNPRTPSAKVGHWTIDLHWVPRKGHGSDQEIPRPSDEEIRRRQR